MKDNQIIKKLHLLQSIQPDASILYSIKQDIFDAKEQHKKNIPFKRPFLFIAFPLASFAVFVFILLLMRSEYKGEVVTSIHIALESNQFDKAQIAYAYANT